jgi:hypothetical protein
VSGSDCLLWLVTGKQNTYRYIHSVIVPSASFTIPSFYLSHKITLCCITEWSLILG